MPKKAGERFPSTDLMASSGWFMSFPHVLESVPLAEEVPCATSSPMSPGFPGIFAIVLCDFVSLISV